MGAVPGGAFRTFWEPVYRMSIPVNTDIHMKTMFGVIKSDNVTQYKNIKMFLSAAAHTTPCLSMYTGAPPIEATESTRNRQLYL